MSRVERMREVVAAPPDEQLLRWRAEAGWKLVAVEWERPTEGDAALPALNAEIPYGLRVSGDCQRLEEHPGERRALELMAQLIASDQPMSRVAAALNDQGFRMRNGHPWTQTAVFEMLPRLIEAGSEMWRAKARAV